MMGSLATDDVETNAVYYKFIREDPNGIVFTVRDWDPNRYCVDDDLEPNTLYIYQVIAKDMSPNQNETEPSDPFEVTTPPEGVEVDNEAPLPDRSLWLLEPYENSGYHIMAAVVASDADRGGNDPVHYYFYVVNGTGLNSGWQLSNEYVYQQTGNVTYIVWTCDSIPGTELPNPVNSTTASEPAATYGD